MSEQGTCVDVRSYPLTFSGRKWVSSRGQSWRTGWWEVRKRGPSEIITSEPERRAVLCPAGAGTAHEMFTILNVMETLMWAHVLVSSLILPIEHRPGGHSKPHSFRAVVSLSQQRTHDKARETRKLQTGP